MSPGRARKALDDKEGRKVGLYLPTVRKGTEL